MASFSVKFMAPSLPNPTRFSKSTTVKLNATSPQAVAAPPPEVAPERLEPRVEEKDGYWILKEQYRQGINPQEKVKIEKEPMKLFMENGIEELAKILIEEIDQSKLTKDDIDVRLKWLGLFHRRKNQCSTTQHEILKGLEEVGLTSLQSGMDNVRNPVGNPLAGIDPEEIVDTRPYTNLLSQFITGNSRVNPAVSNQFCGQAIIETKARALKIAEEVQRQVSLTRSVRMHWTGCPNTCGQVQVADIGFMGCLTRDKDKKTVEGADVFFGGRIGSDSDLGEVYKKAVPCDDLVPLVVDFLIKNFESLLPMASLSCLLLALLVFSCLLVVPSSADLTKEAIGPFNSLYNLGDIDDFSSSSSAADHIAATLNLPKPQPYAQRGTDFFESGLNFTTPGATIMKPFFFVKNGYQTLFPKGDSIVKSRCHRGLNIFSTLHNDHLWQAVLELRLKYPDVHIIYADYYKAFMDVVKNHDFLGFKTKTLMKACCGSGDGPFNFDVKNKCREEGAVGNLYLVGRSCYMS
ncbi:hypothetical protein K7X08_008857 [Anisodus acutangulus]|uniref:Ferredoxin--nitrite reductase, chloroplastic n=1 Tax=Anisodus acutangulus TaxID=402998 RepID=A0A9Q1RTI1_9SOLA|nr:hypothetical protein K7X08_008857 [Anisodus acutangulus]